jgi:hypothetical protein
MTIQLVGEAASLVYNHRDIAINPIPLTEDQKNITNTASNAGCIVNAIEQALVSHDGSLS